MVVNSLSTQVPCLKSTALAPIAYSSPPAPTQTFISIYKDDINKPDSSVGHSSALRAGGRLWCLVNKMTVLLGLVALPLQQDPVP